MSKRNQVTKIECEMKKSLHTFILQDLGKLWKSDLIVAHSLSDHWQTTVMRMSNKEPVTYSKLNRYPVAYSILNKESGISNQLHVAKQKHKTQVPVHATAQPEPAYISVPMIDTNNDDTDIRECL